MSDKTPIEWTDATFNPWIGCTKVGPGCDNCYAAQQDKFRSWTPEGWGGPRKRTSAANWAQPTKWNAEEFWQCEDCGLRAGAKTFAKLGHKGDCPHYSTMKVRQRVFCASLADVFDNQVDPQWRADLFALIEATPNLDWLLLTKRVGNVRGMVPPAWLEPGGWPKHVRVGATIVNQPEADRDIDNLLALPCPNFLSMEPLLAEVDISTHLWGPASPCADCSKDADCECGWKPRHELEGEHGLDWVIVGGESGPGARSMVLGWAKSLVRQCKDAGVPVMVKQLGAKPTNREGGIHVIRDKKGADLADWPEVLRVREFPK